MSGINLARNLQKSGVLQARGVAFEAAIIAAASKKVHMTLSSKDLWNQFIYDFLEFDV